MKKIFLALAASTFLTSAASAAELKRVVTVPLGAEITGIFMVGPDLFFNVQHPSDDIPTQFSKAAVGVISNADFGADASPMPTEMADKQKVVSTLGGYQILFQEGSFDGKIASISGEGGKIKVSTDPDFNAYVPTGANEGHLFTNWEDRPGGMSRVKISRAEDGTWTADAPMAGRHAMSTWPIWLCSRSPFRISTASVSRKSMRAPLASI